LTHYKCLYSRLPNYKFGRTERGRYISNHIPSLRDGEPPIPKIIQIPKITAQTITA
jgi:hypothetical protein